MFLTNRATTGKTPSPIPVRHCEVIRGKNGEDCVCQRKFEWKYV